MKPMLLKDYPAGAVVFTRERLNDEVRETFYIRERNHDLVRYSYNIPISRIGFIQFDPLISKIHRQHIREIPCRDPGEASGRTPCYPLDESIFARVIR